MPPGGQATINAIANLLDVPAPTLDEEHGEASEIKTVAYIREDEALVALNVFKPVLWTLFWAAKLMHTVIADECTAVIYALNPAQ